MTIELQGTKFVNVEIFERFLKDNLKNITRRASASTLRN